VGKALKPIRITNATLKNKGKTITNYIHVFDERLKKYFKSFHFYAEYDQDVSEVPLGILNIPALSSMIHFAWAVGADIEVEELDETYFNGIKNAREIFSSNPAYKFLSFNSRLHVGKTVKNTFKKTGKTSLLFSGGIDSTASQILRKPDQLIMIWGLDIPTEWEELWLKIKENYSHLPLTFIKTNTLELHDLGKLYELGKPCSAGYYAGYSFSMITFGVCPPATIERVDNVMMASTYPIRQYGNPNYPFQNYKPHLLVDNHLGWANIETFDVENDYNRPEKIERIIKPYFEENGPSVLRVCGNLKHLKSREDKNSLNCNQCDKCSEAIAILCNYGIDPNTCGFTVNAETLKQIKEDIIVERFNVHRTRYFWGELKKHIDTKHDLHGSRVFLEWLRGYDI